MKATKPAGRTKVRVRASAVASISKVERTKQLGADRAAEIFQDRTSIDPRTDSIVVNAAGISVSAELIERVRDLNDWFEPTRKAVRRTPPTLPEWIEPALRAASPPNAPNAGTVVVTFGRAAGIAPGKQVDLVPLAARVAAFRDEVLEITELGTVLGEDLEQTWAELTHQQPLGRGSKGAFREARKRGTQRDEARWRFLNRLHRMWTGAGRGTLPPTETGLLAVYLGIDDGKLGLDGVVKRWSKMILASKRGTAP